MKFSDFHRVFLKDLLFWEVLVITTNKTCQNKCFLWRTFFYIRFKACNFIKKGTLTQLFSCEFCNIFKSIYFTEHLWETDCFCMLIVILLMHPWFWTWRSLGSDTFRKKCFSEELSCSVKSCQFYDLFDNAGYKFGDFHLIRKNIFTSLFSVHNTVSLHVMNKYV